MNRPSARSRESTQRALTAGQIPESLRPEIDRTVLRQLLLRSHVVEDVRLYEATFDLFWRRRCICRHIPGDKKTQS